MSFTGKVVLITGGSSGIGAAAALLFCKEGGNVVIVGRNESKLHVVAEQCAVVGTKAHIIRADISKDHEVFNIVQSTIDKYGKLDVLVNNAGILDYASLLKGNLLASYDKVMNTNLRSVIAVTTKAVPHLIRTKGNIINISSVLATSISPDITAYCVSKAGMNHFTRNAAKELAGSGVRVNTVSPGPVATDILQNAGALDSWDSFAASSPLKRISQPDEVAELIMFLASDKAKSVTGSEYMIDNGMHLKC